MNKGDEFLAKLKQSLAGNVVVLEGQVSIYELETLRELFRSCLSEMQGDIRTDEDMQALLANQVALVNGLYRYYRSLGDKSPVIL